MMTAPRFRNLLAPRCGIRWVIRTCWVCSFELRGCRPAITTCVADWSTHVQGEQRGLRLLRGHDLEADPAARGEGHSSPTRSPRRILSVGGRLTGLLPTGSQRQRVVLTVAAPDRAPTLLTLSTVATMGFAPQTARSAGHAGCSPGTVDFCMLRQHPSDHEHFKISVKLRRREAPHFPATRGSIVCSDPVMSPASRRAAQAPAGDPFGDSAATARVARSWKLDTACCIARHLSWSGGGRRRPLLAPQRGRACTTPIAPPIRSPLARPSNCAGCSRCRGDADLGRAARPKVRANDAAEVRPILSQDPRRRPRLQDAGAAAARRSTRCVRSCAGPADRGRRPDLALVWNSDPASPASVRRMGMRAR